MVDVSWTTPKKDNGKFEEDLEEQDPNKSNFRLSVSLKRLSDLQGKNLPRVYAPRFPKASFRTYIYSKSQIQSFHHLLSAS